MTHADCHHETQLLVVNGNSIGCDRQRLLGRLMAMGAVTAAAPRIARLILHRKRCAFVAVGRQFEPPSRAATNVRQPITARCSRRRTRRGENCRRKKKPAIITTRSRRNMSAKLSKRTSPQTAQEGRPPTEGCAHDTLHGSQHSEECQTIGALRAVAWFVPSVYQSIGYVLLHRRDIVSRLRSTTHWQNSARPIERGNTGLASWKRVASDAANVFLEIP